jgi:hypothetical protein
MFQRVNIFVCPMQQVGNWLSCIVYVHHTPFRLRLHVHSELMSDFLSWFITNKTADAFTSSNISVGVLLQQFYSSFLLGARGSVVGSGTVLQAALRPWGRLKPLTEMSTRNLPGGKKRPARKDDNLTAICDPIV